MNNRRSTPPRIHRQTLIEMNRAVFTARRDSAHTRLVAILREHIDCNSKEKRAGLYADCLELLEEVLRSTQRSQIPQGSPFIHYLELLRETLKAQFALVNHEITLVREAREFTKALGKETVARLQQPSDLFSGSEKYLLDSVHNLLEFGEPLRQRDTKQRQKTFSEDDWRRYHHAKSEFETYYQSFGP